MKRCLILLMALTVTVPSIADETAMRPAEQSVAAVLNAIDRHLVAIEERSEGSLSHEVTEIRHCMNQLLRLAEAATRDGSTERQDFFLSREALAQLAEKRRARAATETPQRPKPEQGRTTHSRDFAPEDFPEPIPKRKGDDDAAAEGPTLSQKVDANRDAHKKQIEEYEKQQEKSQAEANVTFEDQLDKAKSSPDALRQFIKDIEVAQSKESLSSSQAAALLKSARGILSKQAQDAATDHFEGLIEDATTADQLKQLKTQIRNARQGGRISDENATSLLGKADTAIESLSADKNPQ